MAQGTSPFRIIILDSSDTELGELTTATTCNTKEVLDGIGEVSFAYPAGDPATDLITAGSHFHIYDLVDGDLGVFQYRDSSISEQTGIALRTVTADSILIELTQTFVGWRRKYTNHPVAQVVTELASFAGWTTEATLNIGNTAVTYEGNTPLQGIDDLAQRWAYHYRVKRNATRTLEFKTFGSASGVLLHNLRGQVQPAIALHPKTGFIDSLQWKEDGKTITNKIVAVGSGQGVAQTSMVGATAGSYPLLSAANQDGSLYYYIQDNTSIARYGTRLKVLAVSNVRPAENATTAPALSADALKVTAESYLLKNKDPKKTYTLTARQVSTDLQVGDTVRVIYRATRDRVVYLDIDESVYVLGIQRSRATTGDRRVTLTLGTVADRPASDANTLVEMVSAIHSLKTAVQPVYAAFQFLDSGFVDVNGWLAVCDFVIGAEITNIQKVTLSLSAFRMESPVTQTNNANKTVYFWVTGAYPTTWQNVFPDYLKLSIDGVDVTSDFDGPFRWSEPATPSLAGINQSLDITSYILNSPYGVYAEHVLQVSIDVTAPAWTAALDLNGVGDVVSLSNKGRIRFNIRIESITQAIQTG